MWSDPHRKCPRQKRMENVVKCSRWPYWPFSSRTGYLIDVQRKMLQVNECNLLPASAHKLISRVFYINISSTFAGGEFSLLRAHDAAKNHTLPLCNLVRAPTLITRSYNLIAALAGKRISWSALALLAGSGNLSRWGWSCSLQDCGTGRPLGWRTSPTQRSPKHGNSPIQGLFHQRNEVCWIFI